MKDRLSTKHVKGHQDDEKDVQELSLEARLNVELDKLAGEVSNDDGDFTYLISGTSVVLHSRHGIITSNYARNIHGFASNKSMKS